MESQPFEKQMFSTNRKEKIFNVRRVPYKQFDNEKYLKSNFSPFQKKELTREPASTQPKKGDYLGLGVLSGPQKELTRKFQAMKEQLNSEKQRRLQKLKQREEELAKYKTQNERLQVEKSKLLERREEIKARIQELRDRNEAMRQEQQQRNEQIRIMNMEYLRNMVMAMRYQNGIEIDPDAMTYEQLLELQEKMGSVSKGLSEDQLARIRRVEAMGIDQVCSICYYNIKQGEKIVQLPCQHYFHDQCIQEWLRKQKTCPLCKQQIFLTSSLLDETEKGS